MFPKEEQTPLQDGKLTGAALAAAPVPLIIGAEQTDVPWTSRTPAAKRVRRIFPDLGKLTENPVFKAGDAIRLTLFDDAVFDATISNVTRYPNGAVGLTAHLQDGQDGTVYLSYCDQQLRVSVEVMGGADYYVRYNPETGEHYAIEVDRENTEVRECGDVRIPRETPVHSESLAPSEIESEPIAQADPPAGTTQIDVMIVYTPAALAYEGNTANMNANIAGAMQKANEAHGNSDTQIYLNLVHSAETSYTESGDAGDDLARLTGTSDGDMDEVHALRTTFGADFVCLFMDTSQVGGIGWLLDTSAGDPSHAFCIARVQQSEWSYTVVHEWGHNMGCGHSKTQGFQNGPGLDNYSAGWQWNDTKSSASDGYCSVMTYEVWSGNYKYKRVGHFSNPNINYVGNSSNPTGEAINGDNARTMREMKDIYAAYRDPPLTPPVIETAPASLTLSADLDAPDLTDSVSLVISNSGQSTLSFLISDGTQTNNYTWTDSNDPGGPAFNWIDISSNYTGAVSLSQEAESTMLDIGFSFPLYGTGYTQFQIAANGGIFLEPGDLYNKNYPLPANPSPHNTNVAPSALIAPFWDDLGLIFSSSDHWYRRDADRVVITYPSVYNRENPKPNTFQTILYRDGRILFQYLDMQGSVNEATVGIQGGSEGPAIQVAYNEPYITNGLAVEFRPPFDWLSYANASGTVETNQSTSILFVADASTLPTGTYETVVTVLHNDPDRSAVDIPLVFNVTGSSGTPGDLDGDGLPDDWETLYFGGPTNANPNATASNSINTVWETYIAGLDPTSPTNRFLTSILSPSPSDPILRWNSVSGRVYSVWWSSNLLSGFQPLETNILFPQSSYTDTLYKSRFYKIDVHIE